MLSIKKITLLFFIFLLLSCRPNTQDTSNELHTKLVSFGTIINITLRGIDPEHANVLIRQIEIKLNRMDQQWHAWRASALTSINRACKDGTLYVADPSMIELIQLGKLLETKSQGLFNPAFGEVIALWGFHSNDPTKIKTLPNPNEIKTLLEHQPSMNHLYISGNTVACDNTYIKLDFGGFAKGYAVESLAHFLNAQGVPDVLIDAGGDIYLIDEEPYHPWQIALRDPKHHKPIAILSLTGKKGVFTSGIYERQFSVNNRSYHHVIDPRTGYPSNGFTSVTVIHPNAALADAAATALLIAGPQEWKTIAKTLGVEQVILIDEDNHLYISETLKSSIKLLEPSLSVSYLN